MSLLNVQRAWVAAITRAEVGIVHLQAVADGEKDAANRNRLPGLDRPGRGRGCRSSQHHGNGNGAWNRGR